MDVLVLSETKVKGTGEHEWEGERVIVAGVSERMRTFCVLLYKRSAE